MAFNYNEGPLETTGSIEYISRVIRDIGEGRQFMSGLRKLYTGPSGKWDYCAFSPVGDDDPYYAGPTPDWQIGFASSLSTTNSMGMTYTQGYRVIFRVFDQGSRRRIEIKATGNGLGLERETRRLVKMVLAQLP